MTGLHITDERPKVGDFDIYIVGRFLSPTEVEVNVNGRGFDPSPEGVKNLADMLITTAGNVLAQLNEQDPNAPAGIPTELVDTQPMEPASLPDAGVHHNHADGACRMREEGEPTSGAARCPVCRPIRPAFNPQPRGAQ